MPHPKPAIDLRVALLLEAIDQAYERKAWHGPNLRGVLRGVDVAQASWRPADGRHTIWELTLHCAYWKYAVTRRLVGAPRGGFPRKGSNWLERPTDGASDHDAWRADLALLRDTHRALRHAVAALGPTALDPPPDGGGEFTVASLIQGVAFHDTYHGGQIQLMKRLFATL